METKNLPRLNGVELTGSNGDLINQVAYADELIDKVYDLVASLEAAQKIAREKERAVNKLTYEEADALGLVVLADELELRQRVLSELINELKTCGQSSHPNPKD